MKNWTFILTTTTDLYQSIFAIIDAINCLNYCVFTNLIMYFAAY